MVHSYVSASLPMHRKRNPFEDPLDRDTSGDRLQRSAAPVATCQGLPALPVLSPKGIINGQL